VDWANHPEALGSRNTQITADYPAQLYARLEQQLGGVAVFLNGAIGGMQSPLGAKVKDPATGEVLQEHTFRKAELIGRRVADLAVDAIQAEKPVRIDRVEHREAEIRIPITNQGFLLMAQAKVFGSRKPFQTEPVNQTSVGVVRLLSRNKPVLEIALVPGELYPELSVGGTEKYEGADFPEAPVEPAIKKMMTAEYRMLVGLANDEIGYIIPRVEWDERSPWLRNAPKRWYGEVNSVGPDAAPIIAEALGKLLKPNRAGAQNPR
jgi:hypothetical protein